MPFTPAHIAVVLPFRKWMNKDIFLAAALGCIIPDMEYFLRFNPASGFSHTLKGIFIFDLPLVMICYFLWKRFLGDAIHKYVPYLKPREVKKSKAPVIYIIIAALAGILSHLLWDVFTHGKGYFVVRSEWLQQHISIAGTDIKMCYIMWYVCSFLGTLYCINQFFRFKKIPERSSTINDFWGKVFFIMLMIAVVRIALGLSHNVPRHLVIILIGAFIYSFVIVAFSEREKLGD